MPPKDKVQITQEQVLLYLSSVPQKVVNDILLCLMDKGVLNIRALFDLYESRIYAMQQRCNAKVDEAEGIVFSLLFPILYDTKSLSESSKRVTADAIRFVEQLGKHRTQAINEKFAEKCTPLCQH